MSAALFDALMDSPDLPEILGEAQRALVAEQKLRRKFYKDITPEHKWEFIQGEVILHSPALHRHLVATQHFYNLLHAHVVARECGQVLLEKAMTCFPRNDYEPDVCYFGATKSVLIQPDTLKFPIPDLIVEVLSKSTEKRDRGIKFKDYALHGVAEYWIIDPKAETVELYRLAGEAYPPAKKQSKGQLRSTVVPGFEIALRSIFDAGENAREMRRLWKTV